MTASLGSQWKGRKEQGRGRASDVHEEPLGADGSITVTMGVMVSGCTHLVNLQTVHILCGVCCLSVSPQQKC